MRRLQSSLTAQEYPTSRNVWISVKSLGEAIPAAVRRTCNIVAIIRLFLSNVFDNGEQMDVLFIYEKGRNRRKVRILWR
jgi:hypothetical protein